MAVFYEWDVELVDSESLDILDHYVQDSYQACLEQMEEAPDDGCHWTVVLVRNADKGRSWAYIVDGKLPDVFKDSMGDEPAKVPDRFHKEVEKNNK